MDAKYALDDELQIALGDFLKKYPPIEQFEKGDWRKLRQVADVLLTNMFSEIPKYSDVSLQKFMTKAADGSELDLHWYSHIETPSRSAIVFIHGGGRMAGSLDIYRPLLEQYVHQTGVSFLAVGYRLSPGVQGKTSAEDAFAGLCWLKKNASLMDIDEDRIAIMGDSGGGGIAAGTAILAREQGIPLSRQILIYPMLDNRTIVPDEQLLPFALWNYDANCTAWQASLGVEMDDTDNCPIAVPAHLSDFSDLAPAYIEVGFLDIFRNESINYAQNLAKAGITVEFHLHPGSTHAFDVIAPNSSVAQRAINDRIRVIRSI